MLSLEQQTAEAGGWSRPSRGAPSRRTDVVYPVPGTVEPSHPDFHPVEASS